MTSIGIAKPAVGAGARHARAAPALGRAQFTLPAPVAAARLSAAPPLLPWVHLVCELQQARARLLEAQLPLTDCGRATVGAAIAITQSPPLPGRSRAAATTAQLVGAQQREVSHRVHAHDVHPTWGRLSVSTRRARPEHHARGREHAVRPGATPSRRGSMCAAAGPRGGVSAARSR